MSTLEHVDVLIVGAGLSGIGAAHHLQQECPGKSYVILEARDAIGGTWDLFRYPGIRSDSDMFTLGYDFKPWRAAKAIADGPSILDYVRETAREDGSERRIRFGHRVVRASWSSADSRWTVEAQRGDTGETASFTCGWLYSCTGYYRYDEPYVPELPGAERFGGPVFHPQLWPADLDYAGKRVVVIGSGATAVTLVPAMTDKAAHVTMLQRSPTYVVSMPGEDPVAKVVRRVLPDKAAYPLLRWKNVLLQMGFFQLARRRPETAKRLLRKGLEQHLSPEAITPHFEPTYDPWDQRVCLVPDADLFEAITAGSASVVTDRIETFTERGILLASGRELEADIVITATGLNLLALGGMAFEVDGAEVSIPDAVGYKGMMLSGVPNFSFAIGYTNASWTLKADLTSRYVCRLLKHMDAGGLRQATPLAPDPSKPTHPFLDLDSGYVRRSMHEFPRQGDRAPWKLFQNYARDIALLRRGKVEDEGIVFSRGGAPAEAAREPLAA